MSRLAVTLDGQTFELSLNWTPQDGNQFNVEINGEPVPVIIPDLESARDVFEWIIVDGRPLELIYDQDLHWIRTYTGFHQLEIRDLEAVVSRARSGESRIKAPIPGLISRVLVEIGQHVETGRPILVLEAMKMENLIHAPLSGTVTSIHVRPGQSVTMQDLLIEISE